MPRTSLRTPDPRIQDVPLPGMAQCITLQVNATFYRAGRTMRWVCIARDPDGNMELDRLIGTLRPDDGGARASLLDDVAAAIDSVEYQLHGTATEVKEVLADHERAASAPPRRTRKAASS